MLIDTEITMPALVAFFHNAPLHLTAEGQPYTAWHGQVMGEPGLAQSQKIACFVMEGTHNTLVSEQASVAVLTLSGGDACVESAQLDIQ